MLIFHTAIGIRNNEAKSITENNYRMTLLWSDKPSRTANENLYQKTSQGGLGVSNITKYCSASKVSLISKWLEH